MSDPTPAPAPAPPFAPLVYRPADLAQVLRVSPQMITKHLAAGTSKAVKLGDAVPILADHVNEVLRSLPRAQYANAPVEPAQEKAATAA